ncbi:unnamed protein product, partial [Iphiclides podalirius]
MGTCSWAAVITYHQGHLDTNTLDLRKKEHRHLVLQIALKCADISNPCRPWEISRKWSLKVCEEFFRQGDFERKLNLPVTALCDRHNNSIPKIQTGFFKFVVTPLITEWHRFLQNDLSTQMLDNLVYNQKKWEALHAKEMADETRTEISDADVAEDDAETCSFTNMSDSSELLLPVRRSSLNPVKPGFKEQLRRFSVPLNVFQDAKFKGRDRSRASPSGEYRHESPADSEYSLQSHLSTRCYEPSAEKAPSTEKLLSDSTIASITTPVQATRLSTVAKEGGGWKLVRQQTFPPLETTGREHALMARPLYTSDEDAIYPSRLTRPDFLQRLESMRDGRFSLFRKSETERYEDAPDGNGAEGAGSQLRDNLTAATLGALATDQLLRRRKSMPTEAVAYAHKEKKVREVTAAIPQLLRRTLSGKECWARRRGSAPAPVAASELRGLTALRHSANGGRRKTGPVISCQQWLAKAAYATQERSFPNLPRRSSLPVEVFHPDEKMKTSESK